MSNSGDYVEWAKQRARQIRPCDTDGENQQHCYWHHRPHISPPEDLDVGGGRYEPSFDAMLRFDELYPADFENDWSIEYTYLWNLDTDVLAIEVATPDIGARSEFYLALDDPDLVSVIEAGSDAFQEQAWSVRAG